MPEGHRFLRSAEEALQLLGDEHACSSAANIVDKTTQVLISDSAANAQLVASPPQSVSLPTTKTPIKPATKIPAVWQPTAKTPLLVNSMHEAESSFAQVTLMLPKALPTATYTCPATGALITPIIDAELVRHLLFPELVTKFSKGKISESLGGFHHDYGGRLRKMGRVSYIGVVDGPLGTFQAQKVVIDGKAYGPKKSFFPETMDHQTIVDNIWNVIGNGKVDFLENGDLKITGIGKSGIKITLFVTQKGNVTTAYPVI